MITRVHAVIGVLTLAFAAGAADQVKFVLVRSVTEIDEGANGTFLPHLATDYSYHGRVLTGWSLETDLSGDGTMDERHVSTRRYDSQGRMISDISEVFEIATGVLVGRGVITYTYDSNGNRTGREIESDTYR